MTPRTPYMSVSLCLTHSHTDKHEPSRAVALEDSVTVGCENEEFRVRFPLGKILKPFQPSVGTRVLFDRLCRDTDRYLVARALRPFGRRHLQVAMDKSRDEDPDSR